MKTVQIHEIEFPDNETAMLSKNYPNSGLFIVKIKGANCDLRFIDKSAINNFCIAPEAIMNKVLNIIVIKDPIVFHEEELIPFESNLKTEIQQYDGDFILEFARILLNRK